VRGPRGDDPLSVQREPWGRRTPFFRHAPIRTRLRDGTRDRRWSGGTNVPEACTASQQDLVDFDDVERPLDRITERRRPRCAAPKVPLAVGRGEYDGPAARPPSRVSVTRIPDARRRLCSTDDAPGGRASSRLTWSGRRVPAPHYGRLMAGSPAGGFLPPVSREQFRPSMGSLRRMVLDHRDPALDRCRGRQHRQSPARCSRSPRPWKSGEHGR